MIDQSFERRLGSNVPVCWGVLCVCALHDRPIDFGGNVASVLFWGGLHTESIINQGRPIPGQALNVARLFGRSSRRVEQHRRILIFKFDWPFMAASPSCLGHLCFCCLFLWLCACVLMSLFASIYVAVPCVCALAVWDHGAVQLWVEGLFPRSIDGRLVDWSVDAAFRRII